MHWPSSETCPTPYCTRQGNSGQLAGRDERGEGEHNQGRGHARPPLKAATRASCLACLVPRGTLCTELGIVWTAQTVGEASTTPSAPAFP